MEAKYSLEITNKFIEKYNDLDLLRNNPQYDKFIDIITDLDENIIEAEIILERKEEKE